MKITFVMPGKAGGGARMVASFGTGLVERGHDVRILYPSSETKLRDTLRGAYLRLRYGHRHNWLRTFQGIARPYAALTPEVVGTNDFVIGVGVSCVLAISELPRSCGIKVHNSLGREPWLGDRAVQAWRLPMPRVVLTSHLAREMRELGSNDEIFVTRYGIDRSEYFPSLPDDQRNAVGTVYHGAAVKDPDAIRAVLHTVHERRPDTPLIVFGSFPRPRGLPRKARYVRLPTVSMARDLYSRSQVWFCTSRSEGFALPPFEAMACGCAVVCTDCGGPSDYVTSGENGFIVPVGDVEALSSRIIQLLDDRALREKFVAASRAVLDRFTWKATMDVFESALKSILEREGQTAAS